MHTRDNTGRFTTKRSPAGQELGEPTPRVSNEVGAGQAELAAYAKSQDKAFRKAFPAIGKSVYGYMQASGAAPKRVSDYMREKGRR